MLNSDLKVKETVIVHPQKRRSPYFRGDQLSDLVISNSEKVKDFFSEYSLSLECQSEVAEFLGTLVAHGYLMRLDRTPKDMEKPK